MSFFYKRSTELTISKVTSGFLVNNTVSLNAKDFSFNRNANVEDIQRNTIDPSQKRVSRPEITNLSPVTFSFTTYITPMKPASTVTTPDEYLWLSLLGQDIASRTATYFGVDFENGNVGSLKELTLWFNYSDNSVGYRLDNAIVDSATISLSIEGIAEIQWEGRALNIVSDSSPPSSSDRTNQTNFIKNKLSTISLLFDSVSYSLALTGGTITIDNDNTFYGRSQLGAITTSVGHYTGNRNVSGNLDFYLKTGTNTSEDLLEAIKTNITNSAWETNFLADIQINLGGASVPYMLIDMPQTILSLPTLEWNDLISISIPINLKEDTGNYLNVRHYYA